MVHNYHMKAVLNAQYRHYKGDTYTVIALGKDSNTLEDVVIYRGEYANSEFGDHPVWVRPRNEFEEMVIVDGKEVPRFLAL